ncbi:MAG: hypothetical protein MJ187_03685 [Alphaproteobacteria bacterium]|nr:hypothetical protein [Alphaproteobacteria bacterium]
MNVKNAMKYGTTLLLAMMTGCHGMQENDDRSMEKNSVENNTDSYNLKDKNFIKKFMNDNLNEILILLCDFETYREKPKKHKKESVYTYSLGLTWFYPGPGKKPIRVDNAKTKSMVENLSKQDALNQVKMHLEYETLTKIQSCCKTYGLTNLTKNQIFGLLISAYQLPGHTDGIVARLKNAKSDKQKQADAFQYLGKKNNSNFKTGTLKRRWWCGALYTGLITAADIQNKTCDSFSVVKLANLRSKGKYKMTPKVVKYALAVEKDNGKKITEMAKELNINLLSGTYIVNNNEPQDDDIMFKALSAYNKKDYKTAIDLYSRAIEKSTDNIAAYSDLSISYKKLGDSFKGKNKKSAWGYYEKCCEIVRTGINKINTDEIEKLEIKAQLYYNAGMARYALADMGIDKAKNYKNAQKNYENAKFNAEKAEIDVEPYERALDKFKNKQQSFIDAQNNIKQQETQKTGKFAKAAQIVKQKGKKQSVGKTRSR